MKSSWPQLPLSSIAKLRSGFPFKSADWTDFGIPVIKIGNVKDGRIVEEGVGYVSTEVAASNAEWMTKSGDVLLAMTGYVGEVARVKPGQSFLINQRVGRFDFRIDSPIIPGFLFYFLRHPETRAAIENMARGSAQPNLGSADAAKLLVPTPSLFEQRAIVKVLGTLDDKIDLNRRINHTLEAMAQAIFKSWFVDFDPVKAKIAANAEGRDPLRAAMTAISGKSDTELDTLPPDQFAPLAATAALFPDEMEDSELGEIPKGWTYRPLSQMVNLIGGGTPKRSEAGYWNGEIPWFSVKDAPAEGDVFVIDTEEHITAEGLSKSATRLLPLGVTIISARGTVGKLALVGTPMAMNQSCYGVQGAQGIGPYFNFFNLKTAIDSLKQNTHGAVFDTITQSTFDTVHSVCPQQHERDAFEAVTKPLLQKIQVNLKETRCLAALRDALLPKLLSGELVVPATICSSAAEGK